VSSDRYNFLANLVITIVNFLIWEMKLQKRLLSPITLDFGFRYYLKYCYKSGSKLRQEINNQVPDIINRLAWVEEV
jgi:hypothetical protein